jgi:hypothetical protein
MLARVMPIMMMRAPTMKPCDHASRVTLSMAVGLDCSADAIMEIFYRGWLWGREAQEEKFGLRG